MTIKELEEYQKTHQRIPPEKILAAYNGLPVERINPKFVAQMDQADCPNLVLDNNMRLVAVVYGVDYERRGFIQIQNDDMGEYLIIPQKDADGRNIIPDGWVDSHDFDEWIDDCVDELEKELGWNKN